MELDTLSKNKVLLANALRARRLIPVIGPEAILVNQYGSDGKPHSISFYRVVADKLLQNYGLDVLGHTSPHAGSMWSLHRAVAEILANGEVDSSFIQETLSTLIRELSDKFSPFLPPALTKLAGIVEFDLMIVLTPDDLLVRLLDEKNIQVGSYSPNAASASQVDVSPGGTKRLFFPLGRCASDAGFAIHEEDALEYLYKLNEEGSRRAPNAITELRRKHLLFIGCDFPDWLGRGFLRLANQNRLSSSGKTMEFFCSKVRDPALNTFLTRFSPNSRVLPWSPEELIDVACTLSASASVLPDMQPAVATANAPGPTVFVSYASEDLNAARLIADTLPGLGFSDVWFDRKKLITGDDWSSRIDEAIAQCDFFMPVLSGNADRRREGVFWEEWSKAAERSCRINDAFLLPIGVDPKRPEEMNYQSIFNGFVRGLARGHSLHAINGALGEQERDQLRERCLRFREDRHG